MQPEPLNNILDIVPYKGGEAQIAGAAKVYKLSSNENPLGCSEAAREAYLQSVETLNIYPDGAHDELRTSIANRFGLDAGRIICTNGSDEVFQLLGRTYLQPGDEIIQSEYGFLVYRLIAQQSGAKCISAPTKGFTAQVDAILAAVTPRTKIVFLDNPSNPCGTYIGFEEIKRLHSNLPRNILLVLDAAYAEYVSTNDYSSGLELAATFENVLMTRTFSKIHGLAALRIGWAYGPQRVVDALNRVRGPFNVTAPSLSAATAAMRDVAFSQDSSIHNQKWLDVLTQEISDLGLSPVKSAANFILVGFDAGGMKTADACDEFLKSRGLIVRKVGAYQLPNHLRFSIGTEDANQALISALKDFMRG
jgi:histidinol-phosphate aminotransferase